MMNINFFNNNNLNIYSNTPLSKVNFKGGASDTFLKRRISKVSANMDFDGKTKTRTVLPNKRLYPTAREFQRIYNFTDEEMRTLANAKLLHCIYTGADLRGCMPYAVTDFVVDKDDCKVKKIIKEHNKTTPIVAGKYFKKEGKNVPPVPIEICSRLGFGTTEEINKAIEEGRIDGHAENGKQFVDINGFKTECMLRKMRSENQSVVELSEFALKTGVVKENIINALKNNELVIIKHFLFETDRDKIFIDLNNSKNAEYLDKIGYKNSPLV